MADNSGLLAAQRRALILEEVRRRGGVRVNELTRRLQVSDMTIRRDLDALARQGALAKVHGGAVTLPDEASTHEPGFEAKSVLERGAKEDIAREAARLARPGTAVALSGGTTTFALARRLVRVEDLTVVTNSVRVAEVFAEAARTDPAAVPPSAVVLTGGVRTLSDALVGPVADRTIRSLHFDLLFIGCHGLSVRSGLSTPNLAEAETNRCFVAASRRVVALADHTKWDTVGLSTFAELDDVDTLVTDAGMAEPVRATVAEQVRRLIVAEPADH